MSRTSIKGQFAPRTIEMLRSAAYRVLSLSARRVLDRLEIELADHGGNENGRLPVTYADFHHYGIDRHAIPPAIREVEALGFVEITQRGRAGNAEFRSPNYFRLAAEEVELIAQPDAAKAKWQELNKRARASRSALQRAKYAEQHGESGPGPK
jgi:hypothetical protein